MVCEERAAVGSEPAGVSRQEVDVPQFLELLVSRRKLDWVAGHPGCLRDRDSDELFVLSSPSGVGVTQRV